VFEEPGKGYQLPINNKVSAVKVGVSFRLYKVDRISGLVLNGTSASTDTDCFCDKEFDGRHEISPTGLYEALPYSQKPQMDGFPKVVLSLLYY
jgi:hypothetical protein